MKSDVFFFVDWHPRMRTNRVPMRLEGSMATLRARFSWRRFRSTTLLYCILVRLGYIEGVYSPVHLVILNVEFAQRSWKSIGTFPPPLSMTHQSSEKMQLTQGVRLWHTVSWEQNHKKENKVQVIIEARSPPPYRAFLFASTNNHGSKKVRLTHEECHRYTMAWIRGEVNLLSHECRNFSNGLYEGL